MHRLTNINPSPRHHFSDPDVTSDQRTKILDEMPKFITEYRSDLYAFMARIDSLFYAVSLSAGLAPALVKISKRLLEITSL